MPAHREDLRLVDPLPLQIRAKLHPPLRPLPGRNRAGCAPRPGRQGRSYILHPLRVMAAMRTDEERAVALLHDVIEDGSYDVVRLVDAGIPRHVALAVGCLSRPRGPGAAPVQPLARWSATAA